MYHYLCTDFRIHNASYRNKRSKLGDAGQKNSVPGATCRDVLYLIFKHLESKELRAKIKVEKQIEAYKG